MRRRAHKATGSGAIDALAAGESLRAGAVACMAFIFDASPAGV